MIVVLDFVWYYLIHFIQSRQMTNPLYITKIKKVCRSLCCIFLCILYFICILNFKRDKSKQNFWKYFNIFLSFLRNFPIFIFLKEECKHFMMLFLCKMNKLKSVIVKMDRYNIFSWIFHFFIWLFIYLRSNYEIK